MVDEFDNRIQFPPTLVDFEDDVLLGERKVSGILIESQLIGERVDYVLVGIGVNVNADLSGHPEIASIATSLMMELGREVSRETLAAAILNEMEALYREVSPQHR